MSTIDEALTISAGKDAIRKASPMDERVIKWFKDAPYEKNRNATRIYIPVDGNFDTSPDPIVARELQNRNIEVVDYLKGIAKDKYSRNVRIGKILKDDPEILKRYNNDPSREFARYARNGLYVVLSRHPYDVAGSSTDRSWTSCFEMDPNTKKINNINPKCDLIYNTLIAYLVSKDDKNINDPLARIRLIPVYGKHGLRYKPDSIYGFNSEEFMKIVEDLANKINSSLVRDPDEDIAPKGITPVYVDNPVDFGDADDIAELRSIDLLMYNIVNFLNSEHIDPIISQLPEWIYGISYGICNIVVRNDYKKSVIMESDRYLERMFQLFDSYTEHDTIKDAISYSGFISITGSLISGYASIHNKISPHVSYEWKLFTYGLANPPNKGSEDHYDAMVSLDRAARRAMDDPILAASILYLLLNGHIHELWVESIVNEIQMAGLLNMDSYSVLYDVSDPEDVAHILRFLYPYVDLDDKETKKIYDDFTQSEGMDLEGLLDL